MISSTPTESSALAIQKNACLRLTFHSIFTDFIVQPISDHLIAHPIIRM
ncbi:Uncharacterised protein [Vibrio cholerae]|nr:Uncharacterised protein [Vibrio cholerae]